MQRKHAIIVVAFFIVKTAISLWLIIKKGDVQVDKDIKLGNVGDLDLKFENGKASISINVSVPEAALSGGASISMDGEALIDKIFAAIEAKSPVGAQPIEESVKMLIKAAVSAIK